MKIPTVALVGKPNVGKSTIFNKLIGKKVSIIEDTPGVTRDRIYGTVDYKNYKFHLIDTGGIDIGNEDFNKEIKVQAFDTFQELVSFFTKHFSIDPNSKQLNLFYIDEDGDTVPMDSNDSYLSFLADEYQTEKMIEGELVNE